MNIIEESVIFLVFKKKFVQLERPFLCLVVVFSIRFLFSMSRRRIFDSVPFCIDTYLNNERC
jgi:hypothetical protein